jgi:DNA-directed RNA polymerase subunit RPC12/RpoP
MEDFAAEQDAIRCPRCGGQSAFVPQARALVCQSCGHSRDLTDPDRDRAARRETAYDPGRDDDVPRAEPHVSDGARLHACTACGGQVVFTGQAMSENCPYCNGAVVLGPEEAAYETMGLIPFAIDEPEALTQARDWIARRLAAPGDLRQAVSEGRLAGLLRRSGPSTAMRQSPTGRATMNGRGKTRACETCRAASARGSTTCWCPPRHM